MMYIIQYQKRGTDFLGTNVCIDFMNRIVNTADPNTWVTINTRKD